MRALVTGGRRSNGAPRIGAAVGQAEHDPEEASPAIASALCERIESRTARVAVIGQGYVGLPVAIRAVEMGFRVVGFDTSVERIAALRAGRSYVGDVSDGQLDAALHAGFAPTTDVAALTDFDVAVISVPTPLREGLPDLSFIEEAASTLANVLRPGALIVLESTTYPGTTEELLCPILEQSGLRRGHDFLAGYSPERIDPGNQEWTFVSTPKVVAGIDAASTRCVEAFYSTLVDKVVPTATTAEAEMVKLIENTFRHVNIALVNELAMFARDLGVDIWDALDAAATKPFGFMRFTPGPGVGGHCLPIDPSYLSWRVRRRLGQAFRFVELANEVNGHMPDYVVRRVVALLNQHCRAINGSRILLLGLAYKASTSDCRESPSIACAERLLALGADLRACDPHISTVAASGLELELVPFTPNELARADLVIILVDHPDFDADAIAAHAPLVLDTKGLLRGRAFSGEVL